MAPLCCEEGSNGATIDGLGNKRTTKQSLGIKWPIREQRLEVDMVLTSTQEMSASALLKKQERD